MKCEEELKIQFSSVFPESVRTNDVVWYWMLKDLLQICIKLQPLRGSFPICHECFHTKAGALCLNSSHHVRGNSGWSDSQFASKAQVGHVTKRPNVRASCSEVHERGGNWWLNRFVGWKFHFLLSPTLFVVVYCSKNCSHVLPIVFRYVFIAFSSFHTASSKAWEEISSFPKTNKPLKQKRWNFKDCTMSIEGNRRTKSTIKEQFQ